MTQIWLEGKVISMFDTLGYLLVLIFILGCMPVDFAGAVAWAD